MDKAELDGIIAAHGRWLRGEPEGRRANLRRANLRRADLSDANLRRADLSAANLSAADLSDADLSAADLSAANLSAANLRRADLRRADLRRANLSAADLSAANLSAADLSDANLRRANLSDADLRRANLSDANLRRANLSDADLSPIRDDLWAVLDRVPAEVPGLLAAVQEGRIDGSTYEGECACLVGTIANVRDCPFRDLKLADSDRPAERFFLMIGPGHKPETHEPSRLAAQWIQEWIAKQPATTAPAQA